MNNTIGGTVREGKLLRVSIVTMQNCRILPKGNLVLGAIRGNITYT